MIGTFIRYEVAVLLVVVMLSLLGCVRWRAIYRHLFVAREPVIPSALDDWDEEFKRLTGISPFPEIVIRARVPAALCQDEVTTYSFRDYEARPGDVCYYRGPMGFVVLGNESPGPRS